MLFTIFSSNITKGGLQLPKISVFLPPSVTNRYIFTVFQDESLLICAQSIRTVMLQRVLFSIKKSSDKTHGKSTP